MTLVDALAPVPSVVLTPVRELMDAARAYLAAEQACDTHPDDEAARSEAEQRVAQARAALFVALGRVEGRR